MALDAKLLKDIRLWALQNAVKYGGTANPGAVIGKILATHPGAKSQMAEIGKSVAAIIKDVNGVSAEKQLAELERDAPELLEEKPKEQRVGLKPLENAQKGKVVMRFAPSPSGPLHIGHSFVLSLNAEFCRMYNGKLIVRIEDTNPENIYAPAYKMIPDEANWLTGGLVSQVYVQSDHLGTYYDYAEQVIRKGRAYVCTCDSDVFKNLVNAKKPCPCRGLPVKEQEVRFAKMFGEYEPGQAVLRIKTDIEDPNPAMRDWPAMRINHSKHPRKGNEAKVWPLMNFAVAIDDHLLGVTHTLRGKDHMDNGKRQQHIYDIFGWDAPTHLYIGRINFTGFDLSTSGTRQDIERGKYSDWDDIRLPFLAALRRRGYRPDAFTRYAIAMGVNQADKTVSIEEFFKSIDANDRDIINLEANRYFFVDEPQEIHVEGSPGGESRIHLHPNAPERGDRVFAFADAFYVSKSDYAQFKGGKMYRLMDCLNFRRERGGKCVFDSLGIEEFKGKGEFLMHWLPVGKDAVPVEVCMPDGSVRKGLGEASLRKVKEGEMIQFERFGFCRLDKKDKESLTFWFGHK